MTRTSAIAAFALVLTIAAPAASARHHSGSSPPHAHITDAAKSSAHASNHEPGVTTGSAELGSGQAAAGPDTSMDAAIKAENELIDRKLKGICRGC